MKYDVVIIGAGASGLTAAYRLAFKNPQLNILVIEKEEIAGRKLSASGNGKCNLTNAVYNEDCYHATSSHLTDSWMGHHTYQDVVSFFENMGILLYEKNGYYYPISNQAKQVAVALCEKSQALGVQFAFRTRVTSVMQSQQQNATYVVCATNIDGYNVEYCTDYVLLATGGMAASKLGGCDYGYTIAKKLGLKVNPVYPVLSPIYVDDKNLRIAKGVRIDGAITLKLKEGRIIRESGQIQINQNSLSGIVMMNMSCFVNQRRCETVESLYIDTCPDLSWEQLKQFFLRQVKLFDGQSIVQVLNGLFPASFTAYILKRLKIEKGVLVSDVTDKQWNRLTSLIKKMEFQPQYVEDFEKAQVTGGGISLDEMHLNHFECKQYPHLYIVGEVLDVHGKCGGYNLTFAILSAIDVADNICKKIQS